MQVSPVLEVARRTRFRRTGHPTLVILFPFLINISGCASSPDVKIASTQMTAALAELQAANAAFQRRFTEEVEQTRVEIGNAVVARMVRNRIEQLSGDLSGPDWEKKFESRGLIALSEEIEAAQDEARSLVRTFARERVHPDSSVEAALEAVLQRQAQARRRSAAALQETAPQAAAELERRAATLESGDQMLEAYFVAILELGAMKREIPANMEQLDVLVKILQETHAVIHEYIMTDVKVSGEEVGKLLNEHAAVLGFTSTSGN